MQKTFTLVLVFLVLVLSTAFAQEKAADIVKHPACPLCGMNREMFAHSRVYIEYADSSSDGFCSIHCAAVRLAAGSDKIPAAIQVGDYTTRKLIDAASAVWVIGGSKSGVMSARAKWAFTDQAAASAFIKMNGGELGTFETAMKATYQDMYEDTKWVRDPKRLTAYAAANRITTPPAGSSGSPARTAPLREIGDGLIYDSVSDVTWVADGLVFSKSLKTAAGDPAAPYKGPLIGKVVGAHAVGASDFTYMSAMDRWFATWYGAAAWAGSYTHPWQGKIISGWRLPTTAELDNLFAQTGGTWGSGNTVTPFVWIPPKIWTTQELQYADFSNKNTHGIAAADGFSNVWMVVPGNVAAGGAGK